MHVAECGFCDLKNRPLRWRLGLSSSLELVVKAKAELRKVMGQVKARYITGLTRTPECKDVHHPIVFRERRYRASKKGL